MCLHVPVHACKVVFFHLEMKAGSSWFCGYPYLQNWTVLAWEMMEKVGRVKLQCEKMYFYPKFYPNSCANFTLLATLDGFKRVFTPRASIISTKLYFDNLTSSNHDTSTKNDLFLCFFGRKFLDLATLNMCWKELEKHVQHHIWLRKWKLCSYVFCHLFLYFQWLIWGWYRL